MSEFHTFEQIQHARQRYPLMFLTTVSRPIVPVYEAMPDDTQLSAAAWDAKIDAILADAQAWIATQDLPHE